MSPFFIGVAVIAVVMLTSIAVDLGRILTELRRFNDREDGKKP